MKVRFWGTRGSIATPGPGTNHFGGNTSCVQVTTDDGTLLILDCGTGVRELAIGLAGEKAAEEKAVEAHILLGHAHWDHIQGFPFFTPAFVSGNTVEIYGPEGSGGSLHDVLAGQMEYTYFPVELGQLAAKISYHDLTEGVHMIGGVRVTTQYLNHPAMTLGYRIEADGVALVYLVDHEPFADELWRAGAEPGHIESILHDGDRRHAEFMADADLVIHDAQYAPEEYGPKKTWGHSTYEYAVQVAAAAGVRRVALTHHDPSHDDRFVAEIECRAIEFAAGLKSAPAVFCAYEGCHLELAPHAVVKSFAAPEPAQASVAECHFHILVIDDEPDMRALIERALEQESYSVGKASSGQEGLRMIAERMPDLIVLDYRMPGMDGLDVLRALRLLPGARDLPVLMLTSLADEPHTRAGFDAGVTDYVTKPFSPPQLTARVRACLTRTNSSGQTHSWGLVNSN